MQLKQIGIGHKRSGFIRSITCWSPNACVRTITPDRSELTVDYIAYNVRDQLLIERSAGVQRDGKRGGADYLGIRENRL